MTQDIVVPDRYEALVRRAGDNISHIVERVPNALHEIDAIFRRMKSAGRGAFLVLRGNSGSGKSTFLHTLKYFKSGVVSISVPSGSSISPHLKEDKTEASMRVFILEEREALISFTDVELETWLHEINGFLRSSSGTNALVVWPCNTDRLRDRVITLASQIGGKAMLGPGTGFMDFSGPAQDRFMPIAINTLSLANQSASLADLGLTEDQLRACASKNKLIGDFFSDLHNEIEKVQSAASIALKDREQCRMWVLVVAGNEPHADVSALTRGSFSAIDTERLMVATEANIVAELKKNPEKIGIVGTILDAKILHLPVLATSAIVRSFASERLKVSLRQKNFSLSSADRADAVRRLKQSELGLMLKKERLGIVHRAKKLGSESKAAFEKLANIASTNDRELNECLGRAIVHAGLAISYSIEKDFGDGLTRRTDLVLSTKDGPIRVEVMWRSRTGRADIANYTLTKVNNYAKAIGFLK